jgi:hypothetical protein
MPVKYIPKKEWDEKQKARNQATAELTAEQGKLPDGVVPVRPVATEPDQEFVPVDADAWEKFEEGTQKVHADKGRAQEAVQHHQQRQQPGAAPPAAPAPKPR